MKRPSRLVAKRAGPVDNQGRSLNILRRLRNEITRREEERLGRRLTKRERRNLKKVVPVMLEAAQQEARQ